VIASARPVVLVVGLNVEGVAAARMPRELSRAGLEVALLVPPNAVAAKSRFVAHLGLLPGRFSLYDLVAHVATAVRGLRPVAILPADDVTLRTMMQLVVEPPAALRPDIQQELAGLIAASLGDPAHYVASVDKTRLMQLATSVGIDVPEGAAVAGEDEAVRVAASLGYPVIVRPAYGNAGRGTVKCADEAGVREAMRSLPPATGFAPLEGHVALVQRVVAGRNHNRAAFSWQGREIAAFTRRSVKQYPEPSGPGSVSQYVRVPAITEANRRLVAKLGLTGFTGTQFIVESGTDKAMLIEINRRMTPATHTGANVGVDLAAAFASCLRGEPWAGPADLDADDGPTLALFPMEWMRDPASPLLNALPNDVPWDDPAVVRAFLDPPGRPA
jgi:hypothetical protein